MRVGRILVADDAFAYALPETSLALQPAVSRVAGMLGTPQSVTVSAEGLADWYEVFRVLQFGDIWATHREWITHVRPTFGPMIQQRFDAAAIRMRR